jgi:hypothetical protein
MGLEQGNQDIIAARSKYEESAAHARTGEARYEDVFHKTGALVTGVQELVNIFENANPINEPSVQMVESMEEGHHLLERAIGNDVRIPDLRAALALSSEIITEQQTTGALTANAAKMEEVRRSLPKILHLLTFLHQNANLAWAITTVAEGNISNQILGQINTYLEGGDAVT